LPTHPLVEQRVELALLLSGEPWSEELFNSTSSEHRRLTQQITEKVQYTFTCLHFYTDVTSLFCFGFVTKCSAYNMSFFQISAALEKLTEFKSVSVLNIRCVVSFCELQYNTLAPKSIWTLSSRLKMYKYYCIRLEHMKLF